MKLAAFYAVGVIILCVMLFGGIEDWSIKLRIETQELTSKIEGTPKEPPYCKARTQHPPAVTLSSNSLRGGSGVYFWECNCDRAMEFAKYLMKHPSRIAGKNLISKPAVLGAVISLGKCLDLLELDSLNKVEEAYTTLRLSSEETGWRLPENSGGEDLLLRRLDCAVIQSLHKSLDKKKKYYDSVRGMFTEGKELYPKAGFHKKDHLQLCIRNPNCIKGYFLPRHLKGEHRTV